MRSVVIATLLSAFCLGGTRAQDTTTGPLILQLPGSTRALALGGAYQLTAADADGIFYNPVLLLSGRGLGLAHQRYGGASTLTTLSGAIDVNFGFGVQVVEFVARQLSPNYEIGSPILLGVKGSNPSGEVLGTVGYARAIWKIRLGVAGKWAHHWGAGQEAGVAAFDVGGTLNPISWLTVALALQNLGGTFEFDGVEYDLPSRVVLNLATRPRVIGPLDVSLTGHAHKTAHRDAAGGVGLEASYWPFSGLTFFGRGGLRIGLRADEEFVFGAPVVKERRFTAGGGITYSRVSLDYAWESFELAHDAHRIGLRVR